MACASHCWICADVYSIFSYQVPSGQVAFDLCNHTRTGITFLMRAFGYYLGIWLHNGSFRDL